MGVFLIGSPPVRNVGTHTLSTHGIAPAFFAYSEFSLVRQLIQKENTGSY